MLKFASSTYALYVGIDVAKRTCVVSWVHPEQPDALMPFTIEQTPEGINELCTRMLVEEALAARIHVTLEATGTYHEMLAHALYQRGFALSIINPIQAKRFSEVFLQRDKNDQLDASTLARYGLHMQPRPWTPPSSTYQQLSHYLTHRTTLVKTRVELLNRRQAFALTHSHTPFIDQQIKDQLLLLRRQIDGLEREMAAVLKGDPAWQNTVKYLTTIPGVGFTTAIWVTTLTANFTTCDSAKQLAAFVGLVPRRRQSGTSLNTYTAVGLVGHDDIRQHLYSATLACLRYNPTIRAFYDRVKQRRGSHKLACVAATHKLLHLMWIIAKKGEAFDMNYKASPARVA